MAIQLSTERRRSVTVPFLAIAVVIALAAGLAIGAVGAQSLRSTTNAGAPVAAPVSTLADPGNPLFIPLAASAPSSQACTAIDARAYVPYCGYSNWTRIAAPGATWLACEVMDPTAYRQLCHQGDGGRWVQGAQPGQ
jgi:hypothetical protein